MCRKGFDRKEKVLIGKKMLTSLEMFTWYENLWKFSKWTMKQHVNTGLQKDSKHVKLHKNINLQVHDSIILIMLTF